MRSALARSVAALPVPAPQPAVYLTNDEAAHFLRPSPRIQEKQRPLCGGPRFRQFGRRAMYSVPGLNAWADAHSFTATSDPAYAQHHARDYRAGR